MSISYTAYTGKKQREWKIDAPWDQNPDIELCEHERDEYRYQASAVLNLLEKHPPPVVMNLARALYRCMKSTGLSMNRDLLDAIGDDEQTGAADQGWAALKMAFPKAFDEEP